MYQQAFRLCLRLKGYFGLAVAVALILEFINDAFSVANGTIVGSVLNWGYLAYISHAALLLPDHRDKAKDGVRMVGFSIRLFGLGVLMALPAIILGVFVFLFSNDLDNVDARLFVSITIPALLSAILFVLVLASIGTVLPAYVVQSGKGVSAAFRRGMRTFWNTAAYLLAGPLIFTSIAFIIPFAAVLLFPELLEADHDAPQNMWGSIQSSVTIFLVRLVANAAYAFAVVMTAWVLSCAFLDALKSEGRDAPLRRGNSPL